MAPSSRDRISVDLRGLKAPLFERARATGVLPSDLVRDALIKVLGQPDPSTVNVRVGVLAAPEIRVRLSLRMGRNEARSVLAAARRAGLHPGAYVSELVAGLPLLADGAGRKEHMAALIASCAELSTLSRDIRRLALLLRQGDAPAAQAYRQRLDTLVADVRSHLTLAAGMLADLRPRTLPESASPKA